MNTPQISHHTRQLKRIISYKLTLGYTTKAKYQRQAHGDAYISLGRRATPHQKQGLAGAFPGFATFKQLLFKHRDALAQCNPLPSPAPRVKKSEAFFEVFFILIVVIVVIGIVFVLFVVVVVFDFDAVMHTHNC